MRVSFSKDFSKQARRLSPQQRRKLKERIQIFSENPLDPRLRNHALQGRFKDYRSIDISGDLRALYLQHDAEASFKLIGTHSQLYD